MSFLDGRTFAYAEARERAHESLEGLEGDYLAIPPMPSAYNSYKLFTGKPEHWANKGITEMYGFKGVIRDTSANKIKIIDKQEFKKLKDKNY